MLNGDGAKREDESEPALDGPPVQHLDRDASTGVDDSQQDTQQSTQPAEEEGAEPSESQQLRDRCWGWLEPLARERAPAHFERPHNKYKIGRGVKCNIRLIGNKVSSDHCDIEWDGVEDPSSAITLTDNSSNGTYLNGVRIGKGNARILHNGCELAFGSTMKDPPDDYRFIFRMNVSGPRAGVFAEYDIHDHLGSGAFARVHRAMHIGSGQWYALKIITATDQKMKENFSREISTMEMLSHKNICKLRETFIENERIYLVLELVKGGDLLDRILSLGGLNEVDTRDIVKQMVDALAYMHSKHVAHRDLKPENVLLTDDVPPRVKIADFGLAKLHESQTMLRTMCGTPSYLAPEVVEQGDGGYDNLVDAWSVGVIIFSTLTNTAPFIENTHIKDIRQRIVERKIGWETLIQHDPPFSAECIDFVQQLLKRDVNERMSLEDAVKHPWLDGYVPFCDRAAPEDEHVAAIAAGVSDLDMRSARGTPAPDGMSLDLLTFPGASQQSASSTGVSAIPGAYPRAPGGVARQGSALVRRAQLLARDMPPPPPVLVQTEEVRRTTRATRGGAAARQDRKRPLEEADSDGGAPAAPAKKPKSRAARAAQPPAIQEENSDETGQRAQPAARYGLRSKAPRSG